MSAASVLSGPFVRVTAANFFFFLNFSAFFLLPLHVKALGGTEATVGAVMGTAGFAGICAIPLVGATIDRYGRRRFFVGGSLAMALASVGFLLIDRIGPALYALRAFQGMSFAAAFTGATALAAELAPAQHRARAFGIFGVSTLSTHAIAPAVGEEIARIGGFAMLFAVAAGLSLLAVACALSVRGGGPLGRRGPEHLPWRMDRAQWGLAVTIAFCGLAFGVVITFIPTFVHGSGLGRVGVFFGIYTVAAVLVRLVGGGASDALGRRAVILPSLVLFAGSILLLAFVRSVPMLGVAAVLFGIAQGLSYPALNAFAVDRTAEGHFGRVQALFAGAFNLGVTSAAFAFGAVAERFGYRPMFLVASLTPVVALAFFSATSERAAAVGAHDPASRRAA
jgi:MFS family permease